VLPVVLALGLSSCGDDEGDAATEAFSQVTIEGDPGTAPEVTFDGKLEVDELTTDVLAEGDGEEVEAGDSVLTHIWMGNGFTQEKAISTWDSEKPELVTVDEKTLSKVFLEGIEGQTIGSRVAVAAPAEDAFGAQGNPQLGIGNKDTVLVVVDLLSSVLDEPTGAEGKAPAWAPPIVEKDGTPTGFDFAKAPKPDGKLRSAALVEGEGATVEKGQTIVVNYLGQVYGGKKPFDESYSKGQPTSFAIGTGAVIKGWDQTLVGATVGSRVVMAIPPKLGYGEQGNSGAGIKGTDTLYFVVDILAAG
jgi:peptidylprolyl isomerase